MFVIIKFFVLNFFVLFLFSSLQAMEEPSQENNILSKGVIIKINHKISAICSVWREHVNKIMPAGPTRVHYRTMIELLAQNKGARAYNLSLVSFRDGYVFAARVTFNKPDNSGSLFGFKPEIPEVIPGNRAESNYEKGQNFWWVDWRSGKFSDGTLYFYSDMKFKEFKLLFPVGAYAGSQVFKSDIRLHREIKNNKIYAYCPQSNPIACYLEIIFNSPEKNMGYVKFISVISNKLIGNNYAMISVDDGSSYAYLDWFYPEGVKFVNIKQNNIKQNFLKYQNQEYPILGVGSYGGQKNSAGKNTGIMPLFSLGTPHIKFGNYLIGVGHSKIHTDEEKYKYLENSQISRFRKMLYEKFKNKFGDKYIRHDAYNSKFKINRGYNYLMYFYKIKLDDETKLPAEIYLSDSFLPVSKTLQKSASDYVFSLVFPMGIAKCGLDNCIVSAGMGDYYSIAMLFDTQEILDSCRHDATNLNMRDYEYKLLEFKSQDKVEIINPEKL